MCLPKLVSSVATDSDLKVCLSCSGTGPLTRDVSRDVVTRLHR